jgi:hypothetical protein
VTPKFDDPGPKGRGRFLWWSSGRSPTSKPTPKHLGPARLRRDIRAVEAYRFRQGSSDPGRHNHARRAARQARITSPSSKSDSVTGAAAPPPGLADDRKRSGGSLLGHPTSSLPNPQIEKSSFGKIFLEVALFSIYAVHFPVLYKRYYITLRIGLEMGRIHPRNRSKIDEKLC